MASEEKANELVDLLVDEMHRMLTEGKTVVDKEGEVKTISADAATLNVIRQFLKDQNLGVRSTSPKAQQLAQVLPFPIPTIKDKIA